MPDEKRPYMSEVEVNTRLEALRSDIANGMQDEEVHRLTQISLRTIQRWRLKHGLKRPKGFEARSVADVYAISTLGEALGDARHRTKRSVVDGKWEPPVFMVREHIDYDLFLRILDAAHRLLGMNERELVQGLGMSAKTIEQGLAIFERHRNVSTRTCLTCKEKVDPNLDAHFCSALCERLHAHTK